MYADLFRETMEIKTIVIVFKKISVFLGTDRYERQKPQV
jgi:hypothetical protein